MLWRFYKLAPLTPIFGLGSETQLAWLGNLRLDEEKTRWVQGPGQWLNSFDSQRCKKIYSAYTYWCCDKFQIKIKQKKKKTDLHHLLYLVKGQSSQNSAGQPCSCSKITWENGSGPQWTTLYCIATIPGLSQRLSSKKLCALSGRYQLGEQQDIGRSFVALSRSEKWHLLDLWTVWHSDIFPKEEYSIPSALSQNTSVIT